MQELEIKDIKPLVDIPDYSLHIYILTIIFTSIVVVGIIYILIKHFKKVKKESNRKKIIKKLKSLKRDNSKEFAYNLTKYGREVSNSDRSKKVLEELIEKLEKYKYRANVPNLDKDIEKDYELFLEIVINE